MKRSTRALLVGLCALSALSAVGCIKTYAPTHPRVTFDPRPYYQRTALYVLEGTASYYADSLAGNGTSNGEPYDPENFTAAHRTLPFGTIVRVTRLDTGDWVLVRINDRGPFAGPERILDLSKAAARTLNMLRKGVARIRAEVLELGQPRARTH